MLPARLASSSLLLQQAGALGLLPSAACALMGSRGYHKNVVDHYGALRWAGKWAAAAAVAAAVTSAAAAHAAARMRLRRARACRRSAHVAACS